VDKEKWIEPGFCLVRMGPGGFMARTLRLWLDLSIVCLMLWLMPVPAKPEVVPSSPGVAPARPRMLSEVVRDKMRAGHYSRRTEEAYSGWMRQFLR
jgi:hypothetical protein